MKYSILILDDEPLILEGLKQKLDWEYLNCHVIGSALNGIDGKHLMQTLNPDIVITDIMMPGYSGLELAEFNFHSGNRAKFLILTAYNEFEYAQKAIRYQIEDYILKPIDFQKLIEAVKKTVEKIESARIQKEKVKRLEADIKVSKDLASASLLFNLVRYSEGLLAEEKIFLKDHMLFQVGVILCVKIYNIRRDHETSLMGSIQSKVIKEFQNHGVLILRGSADDKLIFLCQIETNVNGQTARERIIRHANQILYDITCQKEVLCACVVSDIYKNMEELKNCYQESIEQLKSSFFSNQSGVVESIVKGEGPPEIDITPLLHDIKHGNIHAMEAEYDGICKKLRSFHDVEYAVHIFKELRYQAARIASEAGMVQKPQIENQYLSMNFFQLRKTVKLYMQAVCQYSSDGQNLIGKVKLMIEERYFQCQFSLSAAAQSLGVNSSYLSRLFKKEMGENFVDYLVNYRIKKALYLLETTRLKNAEIAAKVGFDDERYFGKVFKKKCGVTPKQHREQ